MIITENGKCRLKRILPGQRNAAEQRFKGFCAVAEEFGLEQDVMQPTMLKKAEKKEGCRFFLVIHADDILE